MTQEAFSSSRNSIPVAAPNSSPANILILAIGTALASLLLLLFFKIRQQNSQETPYSKVNEAAPKTTLSKSKGKASNRVKTAPQDKKYSHCWLASTLKAHSGNVLDVDFAANKKYVASCADDRSLMLWNTKDFEQKDHKFVRVNVEFDYAKKVKWSPDSKAFIICRAKDNNLEVYKVTKKDDGKGLASAVSSQTFATEHKDEIIAMGIASTGKFMMTCSADTTLRLWNLRGEMLASIDTHQVNTYYASISPCGRFIASCGFTSDVKVWHVVFDKMGTFKEVVRAFELKGHSAGVESFSFNDDSSRMASVSKDKTWKLWDTKVEFEKGQEPYLLSTSTCLLEGPAIIALSPDGRVVAIATGHRVHIYSTVTGNEERNIDNEGAINFLVFDPHSKYFLVCVNKHIRIFHNVVGYKVAIQELEERRKSANTQSMRERIQKQIVDAKCSLEAIGEI